MKTPLIIIAILIVLGSAVLLLKRDMIADQIDQADKIVLETDKPSYAEGQAVNYTLTNNSAQPIFVRPNIVALDTLSHLGRVRDVSSDEALATFDQERSDLSKEEFILPTPVKINPGQSVSGRWSGEIFELRGSNDDEDEWERYLPAGRFRLEIFYAPQASDFGLAAEKSTVSSNEFALESNSNILPVTLSLNEGQTKELEFPGAALKITYQQTDYSLAPKEKIVLAVESGPAGQQTIALEPGQAQTVGIDYVIRLEAIARPTEEYDPRRPATPGPVITLTISRVPRPL